MKPVVQSLLETDLYKFTMWQALLHMHLNAIGEYEFKCRNTPAYPLAEFNLVPIGTMAHEYIYQ
jgi:nicotinate phosphoribosyltransferase